MTVAATTERLKGASTVSPVCPEGVRVSDANAISGNPLRAILEVSAALVSSLQLEEVLGNVVAVIGQAMSVWNVGMSSYVPERQIVVFEAWWCEGGITQEDRDYVGTPADLRQRPDLRHIIESQGVQVESVTDPSIPALDREKMTEWGVKTSVDTALRVGDDVIGILGLEEKRFVRRFTPIELDLFDKLCRLAAIGIHNAMVFRRQQERHRHLESLIEVSHALNSGDEPLFATLVRLSARALDAPRALIFEYDEQADAMFPRAVHQDEIVDGYDTSGTTETVEHALGDRELLRRTAPYVFYGTDPDLTDEMRAVLERWDEQTWLNAPIVYDGRYLGVLMLSWTDRERILTADERALIAGIAEQAAAALENARLRARGSAAAAGARHD
jgi:GAF domain-containing protein